jgi:DNA polymerase III gamma/tau subunit
VSKVSGNVELLESAVCEPEELKRQAALFSEADLVRFFHALSETETILRAATQPRYQLEVGIVKLMELRGVETINEILQRLNSLESGSGSAPPPPRKAEPATRTSQAASASTAPVSTPSSGVSSPSPSVVATAAAPAPAPTTPFEKVKAALEAQRKMLLVTALEHALTATLDHTELFIEFAPEFRHFRETLLKPENAKLICAACREVTGQDTGLRIAVKDAQAENEPRSAEDEARREKQRLRETAASSSNVQHLLKTFRGEIVDVRHPDSSD